MSWLRRFSLVAVTSLLRIIIIFGVTLSVVLGLLATPKHLKASLLHINAYSSLVPAFLQSAEQANKQPGAIPLTDKGVSQIVNTAFPPSLIQHSSDALIDSTYNWLEGKAPALAFNIDVTRNRDQAADDIAAYAFNKLAAQPLCKTNPSSVDPFTSPCLPDNFDYKQEQAAYAAAVDKLLPKTVFTANDLPRFSGGKSIAHDFPKAPKYYHLALYIPLFMSGLFLVLTGVLFACNKSRRGAFRQLASIILSSGIALTITPVLYEVVYPHINSALHIQSTSAGINALINSLIQTLSNSFYVLLLKSAIIVVNIGFVLLAVERISRPHGYTNVAIRSGLTSSDKPAKRTGHVSYGAADIPLQSSESKAKPAAGPSGKIYRKLKGKEL